MLKLLSLALALCLGMIPPPVAAQDDGPTFRRVRPPAPGTTRRITIQIQPESQAESPSLVTASPAIARAPVAASWFWSAVPRTPSPDRLSASLRAVENAGGLVPSGVPSQAEFRRLALRHRSALEEAARRERVSPALLLAVIGVESSGNVDAVSRAGAQGLMQLIPATAERFGVDDPFNPVQNILGGAAYLDYLLTRFDGDALLALAGYNAGGTAVERAGGVPPYPETQAYVAKVVAAWSRTRQLCAAPPQSARGSCILPVPDA